MNLPELQLPPLPPDRHYRFHAMLKPSGAERNIDCDYFFYLHKSELLYHEPYARMSDAVLKQHIRQYIEGQIGDEVGFS